ncbi:MAG: 16S rRNA (guanine(966)-N(2))-methyltransferase RsmD [Rubrivivax sp.]
MTSKAGTGRRSAGSAPRKAGPRPALKNEVRLIGGSLRRSRLPVLDHPGLRPTPDRVRETLFNWLGQDLSGWRVLDAFAGSGALGFEAASRGAAEVLLLEQNPLLVDSLNKSRVRLATAAVSVLRGHALAWMAAARAGRFDLVLLDPPFDSDLSEAALQVAAPLVAPSGFLYLESAEPRPEPPASFDRFRHLRAGSVHAQLYRRQPALHPGQQPEISLP